MSDELENDVISREAAIAALQAEVQRQYDLCLDSCPEDVAKACLNIIRDLPLRARPQEPGLSKEWPENAMPEFVVPITRQIHANADDPTDSRTSELREDGPMGQMKWTDGCDALVDFVEEHGGSMGGETREHLFDIVQNIVEERTITNEQLECDFDIEHFCRAHCSWLCIWPPVPRLEWSESRKFLIAEVKRLRGVIEEARDVLGQEYEVIERYGWAGSVEDAIVDARAVLNGGLQE